MSRTVSALVQWFGSNRSNAARVGELLDGCEHVTIPFVGGFCEVPHIAARSLLVGDRHRLLMRLASVTAGKLGATLYRKLRRLAFHPDLFDAACDACAAEGLTRPTSIGNELVGYDRFRKLAGLDAAPWSLVEAAAFFVSAWMQRGGASGTSKEFEGQLSFRWTASGGGSAVRYQSAVRSLPKWRKSLARCEFHVGDAFDILPSVRDVESCGVYCDPPWPDLGNGYKFPFTEDDQRKLAAVLNGFKACRVVVRYGDHPLIRELYPSAGWEWTEYPAKNQGGNEKPEVLLVRKRS